MVHKPALTEERLRTYLDTNQAARERICLAMLNLDRRFSNVVPRHPKGGRDGGCDIDATFKGSEVASVAVAFKNGANDSNAHKRDIKAKFKTDAKAAIAGSPAPSMFVFFTNIALTAAEKSSLRKEAQKIGFSDCELLDRERMRIVLDSTDGLGARLQYLDIPMSPEEQASFFARWGDDIQSLVASRFQSVESTLARLLFLQEARATLRSVHVRLILKHPYAAPEIGHFRAFCSLFFPKVRHGITEILFGSSDKTHRFSPHPYRALPDLPGIEHGISGGTWESHFRLRGDPRDDEAEADYEQRKLTGSSTGRGITDVNQITISYEHTHFFDFNFEPRLTLEELDGAMIMPKLNASLAEKVEAIEIWANRYVLMSLKEEDFNIDRSKVDFSVEGHFSDEELADPWVRIRPSSVSSNFSIDFSARTPKRAFTSKETSDPAS